MATAATQNTTTAATQNTTTAKRKPVFVKVEDLKPGTNGHNLTVKVVSSKPVTNKAPTSSNPRSMAPLNPRPRPRISECLVGDDTGTIIFTARNEQGSYNLFSNLLEMKRQKYAFIGFLRL